MKIANNISQISHPTLGIAKVTAASVGNAVTISHQGVLLKVAYHGTHVTDVDIGDQVLFHDTEQGAFILAVVREEQKPYNLRGSLIISPEKNIALNSPGYIEIESKTMQLTAWPIRLN